MENMEPIITPFVSKVCLTLRYLVGMMRKRIVNTAAMNIKLSTKVLHTDARALNMPTGVSNAPRRIPLERLILKFGFGEPKHEVVLVTLVGILLNALTNAYGKVLLLEIVENIVSIKL